MAGSFPVGPTEYDILGGVFGDVDILGAGEKWDQGATIGDHPVVGNIVGDSNIDTSAFNGDAYGSLEDEANEVLGAIMGAPPDDGDILGWNPFGAIKSIAKAAVNPLDALKKVTKLAKGVVHSPIVKMGATGLAFAFPPVGIPAVAGLMAADRVIQVADGLRGTPAQQTKVRKALVQTAELAKRGDADAKRFVSHFHLAKTLRGVQSKKIAEATGRKGRPRSLLAVVPGTGRIERGNFIKT